MDNYRRLPGLTILLGLFAFSPACGQGTTNAAPGTNAAPATAPAAISLSNVVTSAVADTTKLQTIQGGFASDTTVAEADGKLPAITQEIDQQQAKEAALIESKPSIATLHSAAANWQSISDEIAGLKQPLTDRLATLDQTLSDLADMDTQWQATRTLAAAPSAATPPDILKRIDAVISTIAQTTRLASALRANILSAQDRIAGQETRITAGLAAITKAEQSALSLLFTRDNEPVWTMFSPPALAQNRIALQPFGAQFADLRAYLAGKLPTGVIAILIFDALAFGLFWLRRSIRVDSSDDPAVQRAAQVLEIPLAMAVLLALIVAARLYPSPPRLFLAGLEATALIPAIIILRRLLDRALFPILYALVVAYLVDQARYVAFGEPILARSIFLAELVVALGFLSWLLLSPRLAQPARRSVEESVLRLARIALLLFAAALAANLLGYTRLSSLIGNGMLQSGYLSVILYAAVRIVDGLVLGALRLRPLVLLGMVHRHELQFGLQASRVLRWIAFLFWIWKSLEFFSLRAPILRRLEAVLNATYTIPYSKIPLSLGPLLLFALSVWGTFLLSKFIRFVLEEEVYPHLKLGAGVPYAASTMTHYLILVLGFLFALAALGINLSQYSVLAGALGVGLGFGLQNIMNNFVSGIILLFERPIKVGDVIQIDTAVGTVEKIGIRASIVRITNGSEIIVPNGNLISNQVTNWTLSNRQRVIDVPVTVAAKTDPQKVISLLVETARAHPLVLREPAPVALFTGFTAGAPNFELRAWTANNESWMQIRSDLFLAVSAALTRENIAAA
jgi:small-conductance mechanosensitive channel